MNSIDEQAKQIDWKNHITAIQFYESNGLYFDNFQHISDEDRISNCIDYKLFYCNALNSKSEFDKLFIVLEHITYLREKLNQNHWNYIESGNHSSFLKGMALNSTKKHNDAYIIFKKLTQENKDNYHYKTWFDFVSLDRYNWIFNGLIYLGGALCFLDLLFSLDEKMDIDPGTIGLVILALSLVFQKGLNYYYKRKKRI